MLDFDISKTGLVCRAVIYNTLTSVNKFVVPKLFERTVNRLDHLFVKCKDQAIPVGTSAKRSELQPHIAAALFDKVPDLIIQLLTSVIEAALAFTLQHALVDNPRLKTSMIGTRDKCNIPSLHAVITSQNILEIHIKRMADMEISIGIWWWHNKRIRLTFTAWTEYA